MPDGQEQKQYSDFKVITMMKKWTALVAALVIVAVLPCVSRASIDVTKLANTGQNVTSGLDDSYSYEIVGGASGPKASVAKMGWWIADNPPTSQWISWSSTHRSTKTPFGANIRYSMTFNIDPNTWDPNAAADNLSLLDIKGKFSADNTIVSVKLTNSLVTEQVTGVKLDTLANYAHGLWDFVISGTAVTWATGDNTLIFETADAGLGDTGLRVDQIAPVLRNPPSGDIPEPASFAAWSLLALFAGIGLFRRKRSA